MSLLHWSDEFASGFPEIDAQHHDLVDLINALAPHLIAQELAYTEKIKPLFTQLEQLIALHFAQEEALLATTELAPHILDNHCQGHDYFRATLAKIREAWEAGVQAVSGRDVLGVLADWLFQHLLGADKEIFALVHPERAAQAHAEPPCCSPIAHALVDLYAETHYLLATQEQAIQQAQAANRAHHHFIANLNHEIRTPLNTILGLTWLLQQKQFDSTSNYRLQQINEASHKLLGLISDMLDMSILEAQRLKLTLLDFDVKDVLERVMAQLRPAAANKYLHLRLQILTDDLPTLVHGDPFRLQQILLNLGQNAIKFTNIGTVTLRVSRLNRLCPPLWLRFEVEDSGIGIPEAHRELIFSPFIQGDASLSRRYGGTGLGLAIAQRLAALMGGEIGFSSDAEKGSCFWLDIPLPLVAAAPASVKAVQPPAVQHLAPSDNESAKAKAKAKAQVNHLTPIDPLLEELLQLIMTADINAQNFWQREQARFAPQFGSLATQLSLQLNNYDFDAALATLYAACPQLQPQEPVGFD